MGDGVDATPPTRVLAEDLCKKAANWEPRKGSSFLNAAWALGGFPRGTGGVGHPIVPRPRVEKDRNGTLCRGGVFTALKTKKKNHQLYKGGS